MLKNLPSWALRTDNELLVLLLLDFYTVCLVHINSLSLCALLFLTCLYSCLLGPPASQGAPLLECRCCHCHTCTTHRPSFLPLHSVSPGVQVLLFPFLYSILNHASSYTQFPLLFIFLASECFGAPRLHVVWLLVFQPWTSSFYFPISHLHLTF